MIFGTKKVCEGRGKQCKKGGGTERGSKIKTKLPPVEGRTTELDDAAGRDLDRSAGQKIATHAGGLVGDLERTEARNSDLGAGAQRVGGHVDERVDAFAGVGSGDTAPFGNGVDQLGLVHVGQVGFRCHEDSGLFRQKQTSRQIRGTPSKIIENFVYLVRAARAISMQPFTQSCRIM